MFTPGCTSSLVEDVGARGVKEGDIADHDVVGFGGLFCAGDLQGVGAIVQGAGWDGDQAAHGVFVLRELGEFLAVEREFPFVAEVAVAEA